MTKQSLLPIPDNTRGTWCFLALATPIKGDQQRVIDWRLGEGNRKRIVEINDPDGGNIEDEDLVLAELGRALAEHQYSGKILITFAANDLPLLRTRFFQSSIDQPSLRGFRHISLENLVDSYLLEDELELEHFSSSTKDLDKSIKEMWQLRQRIGPLVPVSALRGEPL